MFLAFPTPSWIHPTKTKTSCPTKIPFPHSCKCWLLWIYRFTFLPTPAIRRQEPPGQESEALLIDGSHNQWLVETGHNWPTHCFKEMWIYTWCSCSRAHSLVQFFSLSFPTSCSSWQVIFSLHFFKKSCKKLHSGPQTKTSLSLYLITCLLFLDTHGSSSWLMTSVLAILSLTTFHDITVCKSQFWLLPFILRCFSWKHFFFIYL